MTRMLGFSGPPTNQPHVHPSTPRQSTRNSNISSPESAGGEDPLEAFMAPWPGGSPGLPQKHSRKVDENADETKQSGFGATNIGRWLYQIDPPLPGTGWTSLVLGPGPRTYLFFVTLPWL